MKPNKFGERLGRLVDKFAKLKLRVKLHAKIGEELRVEMEEEDLVLDPELQDKAFDMAVNEVSDRMATLFAKEVAKQIRAVLERDGDVDETGDGHGGQAEERERAAQARRRWRRREVEKRLGRTGGAEGAEGAGSSGGHGDGGRGPHGDDGHGGNGRSSDNRGDNLGENLGDDRAGSGGIGTAPGGPAGRGSAGQNVPQEPFPRSAEQIYGHLKSFLDKNLGPFDIDDDMIKKLSTRVETEGRKVQRELDLSEEEVMWLATVSLYDIVFLCDDSGSMRQGQRIPALLKTLQSVTAWATRLEPSGVSVRFLNFAGDMNEDYDNIKSGDRLADLVHKVGRDLGRYTRLGTALEEKILRHRAGKGEKPLIAVIITDGNPNGEEKTRFRDSIVEYKNRLGEAGLAAGVVFIIFQVGKSKQAQDYLNSLSEDGELQGLIYRSNQPVDAVMGSLENRLDAVESDVGREYKKYLLEEFISAMMGQTQNS